MISVFFTSIAQQLFLILVGLSFLQIVSSRNRLPFASNLPYAWGIGVVFLYISGFILVRFELAPQSWHWMVLILGLTVILSAGYLYVKSENQKMPAWRWQLKWYDWALIILIMIKLILVLYCNIINPVVDSDASNNYRHVGLAKYIAMGYPLSETMAYKGGQSTILSPPILHSWSNMFQDRWHDSVATIYCFFAYISILCTAFFTSLKTSAKITPALILAYIISTLPILNMHVVRTGYADILVSLFFAMGVSVTVLLLNKAEDMNKRHLFILCIAILGAAMTKMEGTMWSLLLAFFFIGVFAHNRFHISWNKILLIQTGFIASGFIVYYISTDWILANVDMDVRLSWLFQKQYDPKSFEMFFGFMFTWGVFGLFWWFLGFLTFALLITGKFAESKVSIFYTLLPLAALFYMSNFTGNINYTLNGTSVGRFLMQICMIFTLVYTAFIKNFFRLQKVTIGHP